jgi:hypothetical protein
MSLTKDAAEKLRPGSEPPFGKRLPFWGPYGASHAKTQARPGGHDDYHGQSQHVCGHELAKIFQ